MVPGGGGGAGSGRNCLGGSVGGVGDSARLGNAELCGWREEGELRGGGGRGGGVVVVLAEGGVVWTACPDSSEGDGEPEDRRGGNATVRPEPEPIDARCCEEVGRWLLTIPAGVKSNIQRTFF